MPARKRRRDLFVLFRTSRSSVRQAWTRLLFCHRVAGRQGLVLKNNIVLFGLPAAFFHFHHFQEQVLVGGVGFKDGFTQSVFGLF